MRAHFHPGCGALGASPPHPGLPPWPLTDNAIGAFPDAVQLLKLLHAPAAPQLKDRGAGSAGVGQLMQQLKMDLSRSICTKKLVHVLLTKRKDNHTLGLFKWEPEGEGTGPADTECTVGEPAPFQSQGPDACGLKTITAGHRWLKLIQIQFSFPQLPCVSCSTVLRGSW